MNDAFDIDELRYLDTEELAIVHPVTGVPTSWVWTLAGPGHPKTVEQSDRIAREALKAARAKEQAAVNRKKWIEPDKTPDEVRRDNARFFAERVLGWTPARINGEAYPYSPDNCIKLLLDPAYGLIYQQLSEHFRADDSFTQRSATS